MKNARGVNFKEQREAWQKEYDKKYGNVERFTMGKAKEIYQDLTHFFDILLATERDLIREGKLTAQ
jgi:hypothetical protein